MPISQHDDDNMDDGDADADDNNGDNEYEMTMMMSHRWWWMMIDAFPSQYAVPAIFDWSGPHQNTLILSRLRLAFVLDIQYIHNLVQAFC